MKNQTQQSNIETSRSIKAVRIASEYHSINPVEPLNLDSSSVSESPLWDNAVALAMLADPTKKISSNRISEALRYLERTVASEMNFAMVEMDYRAKAVLYRTMSERFLSLVAANQSNPELVRQFLDLAKGADNQAEECRKLAERYMRDSQRQLTELRNQTAIERYNRQQEFHKRTEAELRGLRAESNEEFQIL